MPIKGGRLTFRIRPVTLAQEGQQISIQRSFIYLYTERLRSYTPRLVVTGHKSTSTTSIAESFEDPRNLGAVVVEVRRREGRI